MPRGTLSFGPFRLDMAAHRLLRDDAPVALSPHLVDLLAFLAAHPGELLDKQRIFDAVWPDVFVTDNTLARAVADLRRALDEDPREPRYIQTVARRGYRFVGQVDVAGPDAGRTRERGAREAFDELRRFVGSIADLERLDLASLPQVRDRLAGAAERLPDYAPVHVALASTWTLTYEATRAAPSPDRAALASAVAAARRACELDPSLAEAWATLAFALVSAGEEDEARAAARQAVRLEPDGWRHHFRLSLAAWGEERLRSARRTLALMPGFPYACVLGATVLVARDLLDPARALVEEGLAHGAADRDRLPAFGLHWLAGAVAAVRTSSGDEALAAFAREIASHDPARLYSTEFAVNAWHWRAGVLARRGSRHEAVGALRGALALSPDHARSLVALAVLLRAAGQHVEADLVAARSASALAALRASGRTAEALLCAATEAALRDDDAAVLEAVARLLEERRGHAGWTLPIEPWLQHLRGQPEFDAVLARLRERAA